MAKKPSVCIGIDIGAYSIKIAEVQKKGRDYILTRGLVFNCEGDWKDGLPTEIDVAGISLNKAIAAFGGCKEATLAIPTSTAMVRSIPMESKLKSDELWKTIEANVSQYFPFSAEEVFIDFVPIKPSLTLADHTDTLIVATQKEFVSQREICADIAGIKVNAVDINIYGVLNLLHLQDVFNSLSDYDAVMVFDIGLLQSSLNVVTGDQSVYVREVPIGGERLTQIISDRQGISLSDAEKLKLSQPEAIHESIEQFVAEMNMQLQSAIDVYISNNPQITAHAMYIVGGTACYGEIESAFKSQLGEMNVVSLTPEALFEVEPKVYSKLNDASIHSLTTAAGLAVRGLL
ncbi:type IV pilus assembly protein PilM [Wohlfahrtiimonas larvae]|uniref:Type IV pilus assembly protein PilM n=1 Tax=Wohlfahrtiimonas larvae TaxID=1157986 RepID=A0ABP9MMQ5_9GAMM|nr:type IV pilus assembly protein PilM [Wohlfahrtiimonas larvae]